GHGRRPIRATRTDRTPPRSAQRLAPSTEAGGPAWRHDADRLLRSAASAGGSAPRAWARYCGPAGRPGAPALKEPAEVARASVLRDGAFLRFWGGSLISTLGNQVTVLALPWLVLQLTSSP